MISLPIGRRKLAERQGFDGATLQVGVSPGRDHYRWYGTDLALGRVGRMRQSVDAFIEE